MEIWWKVLLIMSIPSVVSMLATSWYGAWPSLYQETPTDEKKLLIWGRITKSLLAIFFCTMIVCLVIEIVRA